VGARHRLGCCGLGGSEWGGGGGPGGGCGSFPRLGRGGGLVVGAVLPQTPVELLSERHSGRESVQFSSINQRLRQLRRYFHSQMRKTRALISFSFRRVSLKFRVERREVSGTHAKRH
jgi:hypothetical protein